MAQQACSEQGAVAPGEASVTEPEQWWAGDRRDGVHRSLGGGLNCQQVGGQRSMVGGLGGEG